MFSYFHLFTYTSANQKTYENSSVKTGEPWPHADSILSSMSYTWDKNVENPARSRECARFDSSMGTEQR